MRLRNIVGLVVAGVLALTGLSAVGGVAQAADTARISGKVSLPSGYSWSTSSESSRVSLFTWSSRPDGSQHLDRYYDYDWDSGRILSDGSYVLTGLAPGQRYAVCVTNGIWDGVMSTAGLLTTCHGGYVSKDHIWSWDAKPTDPGIAWVTPEAGTAKTGVNINIGRGVVVVYDGNGGKPATRSATLLVGGAVVLPEPPARSGHDFQGWYANSDGSGARLVDGAKVSKDVTVYAKWSPAPNVVPDRAFRACINEYLGEAADASISVGQLATVGDLVCKERGIESVEGAQHLVNAKSLNLDRNKIGSLAPFSGLTGLERLELESNKLSDVSALSGLAGLLWLDISFNDVSDLGPLSSLKLGFLNGYPMPSGLMAVYNHVADLSVMKFCTDYELAAFFDALDAWQKAYSAWYDAGSQGPEPPMPQERAGCSVFRGAPFQRLTASATVGEKRALPKVAGAPGQTLAWRVTQGSATINKDGTVSYPKTGTVVLQFQDQQAGNGRMSVYTDHSSSVSVNYLDWLDFSFTEADCKLQNGSWGATEESPQEDTCTIAASFSGIVTVTVGPASSISGVSVTGTVARGGTLTAKVGSFSPASGKLSYQWYRDGKEIKGATKASYTLGMADMCAKLTVKATVSADGYASSSATSGAVAGPVFSDVPGSHTFYPAVCWIAANGVTAGTGDGSTYSPSAPVNRGSMAAFMQRLSKTQMYCARFTAGVGC